MVAGEAMMVSSDEVNGSTYSGKLATDRSVLRVKPDIRRLPPRGLAGDSGTATLAMVKVKVKVKTREGSWDKEGRQ
jgi:hypothetical protein